MARVFAVPHYNYSALRTLKALADPKGGDLHGLVDAGSLHLDLEVLHDPMASSEDDMMAIHTGTRFSLERLESCRLYAAKLWRRIGDCKVVSDSDAAFDLVRRHLNGDIVPAFAITTDHRATDNFAKCIAELGCIASYMSPVETSRYVHGTALPTDVKKLCPRYASLHWVSEAWRMGASGSAGLARVRDRLNGDLQVEVSLEDIQVRKGGLAKYYPMFDHFVFLGISVHIFGSVAYVMDRTIRAELHDTLYSISGWVVTGAASREEGALDAAIGGLYYVSRSLDARHARGERLDTLAKQMKKSYAVALASYGGIDEVSEAQIPILEQEATKHCKGEQAWFVELAKMSDRNAVDFGTVWNVLPAPEANVSMLADSLEAEMNEPKEYSNEAWDDLLGYTRGVVTAHILYSDPDAEGKWVGLGDVIEEPEWAKSCRRGKLEYPPRGNAAWLSECLEWSEHLEFWHYTAKDVTHVNADYSRYASYSAATNAPRKITNELIYALTYGNLLSEEYTPEFVRQAWASGSIPGDRITMLAAKRENTKPPEEARDTHSGDDVMREALTEVEINFSALGRILHGVTSGAGRRNLEVKIQNVIGSVAQGEALISLDVKGWSRNMPREKELEFHDTLAGFYKGSYRPSAAFKAFDVILAKCGVYKRFTPENGSIQGFFPMADTILHTMVAQWAMVRCREEGFFTAKAKIKKAALIDDIIMRLSDFGGNIRAATERIVYYYGQLGLKAELVKTLMSATKGHFLNRLYHGGFEVLTSAKISAKANREYERSFATIWDRVDSCFGSMLGAADRGLDPVNAYTRAVHRAIECIYSVWPGVLKGGCEITTAVVWAPRAMGGYGFPTFAQWVTREAPSALSSGIATIRCIHSTLKDLNPSIDMSLGSILSSMASLPLTPRGTLGIVDDPFGISIRGVIDPATRVRQYMRKAVLKVNLCSEFSAMMNAMNSAEYSRLIEGALRDYTYPGGIISAWASTLPHQVITKLTMAAERNETLLSYLRVKERHDMRNALRDDDRTAVRQFHLLTRVRMDQKEPPHAAHIVSTLLDRSRLLGNIRVAGYANVSVVDSLTHVASDGAVKLYIPRHDRMSIFHGGPNKTIVRTITSNPLVSSAGVEANKLDPVQKAYVTLAGIVAAVRSYQGDPRPLITAWSMAWLGRPDVPLPSGITLRGTNPHRLGDRVVRKNFSVMALPNMVASVTVDANSLIRALENRHTEFPLLAIVYTLKASAIGDMVVGGADQKGEVRHYSLRHALGIQEHKPDEGPAPDYEPEYSRPVLNRDLARTFVSAAIKKGFVAIKDRDDEFGLITATAGQVLKSMEINAPTRVLQSFGQIGSRLKAPRYSAAEDVKGMVVVPSIRVQAEDIADRLTPSTVLQKAMIIFTLAAKGLEIDSKGADLLILKHRRLLSKASEDILKALEKVRDNHPRVREVANAIISDRRFNREGYYNDRFAEYKARAEGKGKALDKYYGHFMSYVMRGWVSAENIHEASRAMIGAFVAASGAVVSRTLSSDSKTARQANLYYITHFNSASAASFGRFCSELLASALPDDWGNRHEWLMAAERAGAKAYTFFRADWAPHVAPKLEVKEAVVTKREVRLPEVSDVGYKAAEVSEVTMPASSSEEPVGWREWAAANGILVRYSEADQEMRDWFLEENGEQDGGADVE